MTDVIGKPVSAHTVCVPNHYRQDTLHESLRFFYPEPQCLAGELEPTSVSTTFSNLPSPHITVPNVPNLHHILNLLLLHVPSPCLPILPLPSLATTAQQTTPSYITISHNHLVEGLLGGTFEKSTLSTTDSHWPMVPSDVAPMTFSTRKNTGFDENGNPTTIHAAKKKGLATVATCDEKEWEQQMTNGTFIFLDISFQSISALSLANGSLEEICV